MTTNPFDGIYEKMSRADEHIDTLRLEVRDFLGYGAFLDGLITKDGSKESARLVKEHKKRKVPMRIRVLAGEAIHQTRSTLDHAMWVLAKKTTGRPRKTTQFPIFEKRPAHDPEDSERKRWERQTAGLDKAGLTFIDGLQPYTWSEPKRHGLSILKRLNDADKHRSVLVASAVTLPMNMLMFPDGFRSYDLDEGGEEVYRAVNVHVAQTLFRTVVFPDEARKPVVDVLTGLHGAVGIVLYRMKKQFFPELVEELPEPMQSVRIDWDG
jgi:hypothetical protein